MLHGLQVWYGMFLDSLPPLGERILLNVFLLLGRDGVLMRFGLLGV